MQLSGRARQCQASVLRSHAKPCSGSQQGAGRHLGATKRMQRACTRLHSHVKVHDASRVQEVHGRSNVHRNLAASAVPTKQPARAARHFEPQARSQVAASAVPATKAQHSKRSMHAKACMLRGCPAQHMPHELHPVSEQH